MVERDIGELEREVLKHARALLEHNDFSEVYDRMGIEGSRIFDSTLKTLLAKKVVSSISKAKNYAAQKNMSTGISALLLAEYGKK